MVATSVKEDYPVQVRAKEDMEEIRAVPGFEVDLVEKVEAEDLKDLMEATVQNILV